MKLSSTAFNHGGPIPKEYSCDGTGISPPLTIGDVPKTAKNLVLIMDDPDAPRGTFTHWVIWNIPPETITISKGEKILYPQGNTSARRQGYIGPCPPSGTHRYFFKLYAVDTLFSLMSGAERTEVEKMMSGHIVAEVQLLGTYRR